ncbi:MAG TPA: SGNH/GDSL hydrolase family protein [Nitrospirales bacterium]|nr:SGNH/GDSL hydrolase family protein [Nitrospirales bacterium]
MPVPTLPLIICFGDSLTAGFQSPTEECPDYQETPYGRFLAERLVDRARVQISGVCGELTAEMGERFERDVVRHRPAWVVTLGGTNDLGWNLQPVEIMRNLTTMYARAAKAGIRVVAVTVPSIRGFDDHIPRRHDLNVLIAGSCVRRGLPCVDLFTATAEPGTHWLAASYSNDGLHLTTAGYDLLARLLYEQVFKNL